MHLCVLAMRVRPSLVLPLGFFLCLGVAQGQILTELQKDGKTIFCLHSGLSSDLNDCGVHADWYTYVFVGSISAISPANNDEETLQVNPEEIFYGSPSTPLTVLTSQAACLRKLTVGDRWLFYLRKEKGKPILLDYYGNDSLPAGDATDQIDTLRRLEIIGDSGIVRGHVIRDPWGKQEPVPNAVVVAEGGPDNRQFVTNADANGHYEFPALPSGAYRISVYPVGSFKADEAPLDVKPGGCWDLTLTRSPHAQIGGHIRYSDGSPVKGAEVILLNQDDSVWNTISAGEDGSYSFDSLKAGKYAVGIHLLQDPPWNGGGGAGVPPPSASLFYPGVPLRSEAEIITLATDENREGIDFTVSRQ